MDTLQVPAPNFLNRFDKKDKSNQRKFSNSGEALEAVGGFGRYQIYTCIVIQYSAIVGTGTFALGKLGNVTETNESIISCKNDACCRCAAIIDFSQAFMSISTVYTVYISGMIENTLLAFCQKVSQNFNLGSFGQLLPEYSCNDNNHTILPRSGNVSRYEYECSIAQCRNYTANLSNNFQSIAAEWMLICDRSRYLHLIFLLGSLGSVLGRIIGGHIGDYWGRKKALYPSQYGMCLISTLSTACTDWKCFAGFYFFVMVIFGIGEATSFVLVIEKTDRKHRWIANSCFQWSITYPIVALIAYLTGSWRMYLIIINVLLAPLLVFYLIFLESPRWLIYHGELNRAAKTLSSTMEQVRGFDRQFSRWAGGWRQLSAEVGGRAIARNKTPPAKTGDQILSLSAEETKPSNDLKDMGSDRWNRKHVTIEPRDLDQIPNRLAPPPDPKFPSPVELFRSWKRTRLTLTLMFAMLIRSILVHIYIQDGSLSGGSPYTNIGVTVAFPRTHCRCLFIGFGWCLGLIYGFIAWVRALYGISRIWVPFFIMFMDWKIPSFGRRATFLLFFSAILLINVAVTVLEFLSLYKGTIRQVLGLSASALCASGGWMSLAMVMSEAYPTATRGIAYGWIEALDGVGATIGPPILASMDHLSYIPALIFAFMCAVAVVVGYFVIPETKFEPMNDGIHQVITNRRPSRSPSYAEMSVIMQTS